MSIQNILSGMRQGSFFTKSRGRVDNSGQTNDKMLLRLQTARRLRSVNADDRAMEKKSCDREMMEPMQKRFDRHASHGAGSEETEESSSDEGVDLAMIGKDVSLQQLLDQEVMKKKGGKDSTPPPIDGNIYKKWAFFGIFNTSAIASSMGQVSIFIIQLIAPAAMAAYYFFVRIDWAETKFGTGHWHNEKDGKLGWIKALIMVLFLFCFGLNVFNSTQDEEQNWKNSKLLFDLVQAQSKKDTGNVLWLWVGAFVNCQAVIFLCVDTWLLMYTCDGPGDAVMNVVALVFLYKMDDVDSDLVFLGESDWDGGVMGTLLENGINDSEEIGYQPLNGFQEVLDEKEAKDGKIAIWANFYELATEHAGIWNPLHKITAALIFLLTAVTPISYLFVDIEMKKDD
jgi:hypothetical protein